MKQTKLAIIILLAVLMGAGWLSVLGGKTGEVLAISQAVERAQREEERGLYAKAISSYEEALAGKKSKKRYLDLDRVYQLYCEEFPGGNTQRKYQELLTRACRDYPHEELFWEHHVQMLMDKKDYPHAARLLFKAKEAGASSELLEEQLRDAYYTLKFGYTSYSAIRPGCWRGNYVVHAGEEGWGMVDREDSVVLSPVYPVMGPVGRSGNVAVTDNEGRSWLLDTDGMYQVRYDMEIEEAGSWSEGMLPARAKGAKTWSYLTDDGAEVLSGYLEAGSFYEGEAAVRTKEGWQIIDTDGKVVSDHAWEEIRLLPDGGFIQEGCMMAKQDGMWQLLSTSGKPQKDFQCEEIDLSLGGPIAFCRDGRWGFVSPKGEVLLEPTYEQARSFSGGVAAVYKDGLWGLIDEEMELIVKHQFQDIGYFDGEENGCPVLRQNEGGWRIMNWVVER